MVKTQKLRTSSSKRILGYFCSFFTDNIKPRKSVTVANILILPASYSSLKFEALWFRVFDLHGTTLMKLAVQQAPMMEMENNLSMYLANQISWQCENIYARYLL